MSILNSLHKNRLRFVFLVAIGLASLPYQYAAAQAQNEREQEESKQSSEQESKEESKQEPAQVNEKLEWTEAFDQRFLDSVPLLGEFAPNAKAFDQQGNKFRVSDAEGKHTVFVFGCLT